MSGRMTHQHDIVSRYAVPSDVASPEDLTLGPARPGLALPAHALAYCADFAARRVILTHHEAAELGAMFAAPFLFVEQLRRATGVTTVPFESLSALRLAPPGLRPVLVFSPGRTGSTLLARLLTESGVGCASEPDMLTQIARIHPGTWDSLPPGTDTLLAGACIGALCRALGPRTAVKLRGWCNARPMAMVGGFPGCRVVFMLRGMAGWAMSRHRVFQESPDGVAAELLRALDALDALASAGVGVEILWYETLVSDAPGALALFDARLPPDRLERVMQEDSQAGSWIARRRVAGRPVQDGFLQDFAAAWAARSQGRRWSAGTQALLEQMWSTGRA